MDFLKTGFYIWGTGTVSAYLYKGLEEDDYCGQMFFGKKITDLIYDFVDSNEAKVGGYYFGKRIVSVDNYLQSDDFCVIGISEGNRENVVKLLNQYGKNYKEDYCWYDDFLRLLKQRIYVEVCDAQKEQNADITIKDRSFQYALSSFQIEKKSKEERNEYIREKGVEYVAAAINWRYGSSAKDIPLSYFEMFDNNNFVNRNYSRIGIIIRRMYGGGAERVVSRLIPLFLNKGYEVVLFTDEINDKDYELPNGVTRCVIKNTIYGSMQERLLEIKNNVNKYSLDIMCYHFGEEHPEIIYEILMLKSVGIKVFMELHTSFLTRVKYSKSIFDHILTMYKQLDGLVVLSKTDETFWHVLGCKCMYIPNPLEYVEKIEKRKESDGGLSIIWIGRVVQKAKNVLDVVPIMREVVSVYPNVIMRIYGTLDDMLVYKELLAQIKEYRLENNIVYCGYESCVDKIYENADITLITSSEEGFPYVVAESMARGIPIVMYELPWLEMVKDGAGALCVPQKDKRQIACEIINLARNPSLYNSISIDARKEYEKMCSIDVVREWEKVFEIKNDFVISEKEYSLVTRLLLNGMGVKEIV